MQFDYVGVDTETTGLDSRKDEIVEVTVIEFNLSGALGKVMSFLCRPMAGYISPEVSKINGITWEMVKDQPNYLRDGIREQIAAFIGRRTLVGHSVVRFDSKFLKIKTRRMEDTLLLCRNKYRGGNKLKTACQRFGIKWEDSDAHRSEYDVRQCIQLFIKLKEAEERERETRAEAPLFAQAMDAREGIVPPTQEQLTKVSGADLKKLGVIPSEDDKTLIATQSYSYSRIKLFLQCPFKWYMQYVKKMKEPDQDYFTVGNICHKAAEWAGEWCYRQLFANKFVKYAEAKSISIDVETIKGLAVKFSKAAAEITMIDFGLYLYDNPASIKEFVPGADGLSHLVHEMDKTIDAESYEKPSMPDAIAYEDIVQRAVARLKCIDPEVIRDAKRIMSRFYRLKDFSLTPGDITITERRLAFDKNWSTLSDFYANNVFFRGIIDVIDYFGDYVVITDYKTSRKMMKVEELMEDMQTLIYLLLVYLFLPKDSYKTAVIRVEYIRYGQTVEYEITDVKAAADRALKWINESIQAIEKELLKTDGTAFEPTRNEYCHTCYIGEDGKCPLFNKQFINDIGDPFEFIVGDIDDCRNAWKRIEANKAENARLTKACKAFVKQCESDVRIDEHAVLDFYVKQFRDYWPKGMLELLLKKDIPLERLIPYFNLTPTSAEELITAESIELTEEELNSVSKMKKKSEFVAVTPKEAENKNYLNA